MDSENQENLTSASTYREPAKDRISREPEELTRLRNGSAVWPGLDLTRDCGGLFTLPDGSGGTACDVERALSEVESRWEELQVRQVHAERLEYVSPRRKSESKPSAESTVRVHNARAIRVDQVGDLTVRQWRLLVSAFRGKCAYCQKACPVPCLEHVVPVYRGGGTTVKNVVPSCRSCNSGKRIKTPKEWLSPEVFQSFQGRHAHALREALS